MTNYYETTLALAGVCQAAELVKDFAYRGIPSSGQALNISLSSLLQTQPTHLLDVYGGSEHYLKMGLLTLIDQLRGKKSPQFLEVGRYWMGLIALEGKLKHNEKAKNQLSQRLIQLLVQLSPPDGVPFRILECSTFIQELADIYVDIISPLGAKIHVIGQPQLLQQPSIQQAIRACLLAGLRSAVLWRQVGGSKWHFFIQRRKIITTAHQIYQHLS